jgi:hypothetical protein
MLEVVNALKDNVISEVRPELFNYDGDEEEEF